MKYALLTLLAITLTSCQMGRDQYMTDDQRQRIETKFDSLQENYQQMMAMYQNEQDTMPAEITRLYAQMQQMHRDMETNHRQMMERSMGSHMQGGGMMSGKMGTRMQGHMTGEWFQQMMGMHERMAEMHSRRGQQRMADMNQKLSRGYGEMRNMVPGVDEPSDVPFNEQGEASLLNGENLYAQNCASCHGNNAEGTFGAFPPLVNAEWVTGDKSVPIRILLHGLSGEIEVDGQTYQGVMPSFRARLSAAEIAAILNYLRSESDGDQPEISARDVSGIARRYSERTSPWSSTDLTE